jgi:alkylated DNA repair dioxygenase AlkB
LIRSANRLFVQTKVDDMQPNLFDSGSGISGTPPEGFSYFADFLAAEEQSALMTQVQNLQYEHDTFRGTRLRRGYAQFGYAYVSTGRLLTPAAPLPEFLTALITKALPFCPAETTFNQCIVTYYPREAGIGWHTDAPRFGDCIIAVSLGAEASLQLRPNRSQQVSCEVSALPGSLYVMHGPARWQYQHQVLPVASVRYSLTFRDVGQAKKRRA